MLFQYNWHHQSAQSSSASLPVGMPQSKLEAALEEHGFTGVRFYLGTDNLPTISLEYGGVDGPVLPASTAMEGALAVQKLLGGELHFLSLESHSIMLAAHPAVIGFHGDLEGYGAPLSEVAKAWGIVG